MEHLFEMHAFCCLSKSVTLNSPNMLDVKCFILCVLKPRINLLSTLLPNMI
uniref:Uncharacterized protein n=1 Tax=Prolemur simus TaxID=1328070 RepID=A0A8C9DTF8_PROSS